MHRHSWKGFSGLSTEEAFDRLFLELGATLEQYLKDRGRNWKKVLSTSFSTRSKYTILSWCSLVVLITDFLVILTLYCANYTQIWTNLLPEAIALLLLAVINVALQMWEGYKRVNELPVKIEKTLEILKELVRNVEWNEENYPDLYMPYSPCITVQWCYRDKRLVNLPWSFLVPGDLISLQPAQKIIAKCQILDEAREVILEAGTYYTPNQGRSMIPPPKLHSPLTNQKAIVLESPYVLTIKHYLENMKNKPSTFYNKERHGIINRFVECIILPVAIMIFVALCLVRLFYLPLWLGIRVAPWSELIVLQPMTYTLPLLPLGLPLIWFFLHAIGNAKIHVLFQMAKESEFDCSERFDLRLRRIWSDVLGFFCAKDETLHRSQGLLHILASATALCCVDKKGILSWPNPTADKIFFLKSKPDKRIIDSEVLDITHNNNNAFELHFDDPSWESHLSNLKPLGLNILLNTCNWETRATYSAFHSYISQELIINPDDELVVPVTGRRCLCEVARMIGFEEKATCCFQLEEELCSFRHIESDEFCRDKFHKAKIKFPFPHMMSVVVKERAGMSLQLMAQGTGDLILDNCEDFWDGQDLRVLTDSERKQIMDFYQRFSLTSICTAFSYRPLSTKVSRKVAALYTELAPSKGLHFWPYYDYNNTTKSTDCLLGSNKESERNDLEGSVEVQSGQIFLGMITMQYQACMDIVQLIEQLDTACIRFVHFSKENELRSRVFSEKMGLESGWNCHISLSNQADYAHPEDLLDDSTGDEFRDSHLLSVPGFNNLSPVGSSSVAQVSVVVTGIHGNKPGGKISELRRGSSSSVPELIKLSAVTTTPAGGIAGTCMEGLEQIGGSDRIVRFAESCCKFDRRNDSVTPSESCGGEVYGEHPNTPLGFDMSNRAKLPRGIEQVRPHLENVDNVPLLVSLFTDCTAENATEMIHIMQDYGEVTIVLGSVCSMENKHLFSQADASVGVEPMYPQACQKQQVFVPTFPSPTEVAMLMTSIPCSLFFKRTEQLAFYPMIAQARHYMNNCVRNTFQFWICCQVTLVVLGLIATLILLPPLYTLGDSIWLVAAVIPSMSLGLAFSIMDRVEDDVMSRASWKNQWVLDRQLATYAFWFYGMKFIPSLVNVVCMAVFNFTWICANMSNTTCSWVYPIPKGHLVTGNTNLPNSCVALNWGCENAEKLLFVQQYSIFFLVLYFVTISACFVYRSKYLWEKNPIFNKVWLGTSFGVIIGQCFYTLIKLRSFTIFTLVPLISYIWGFVWLFLLLGFNELLRRQEIKINIRYQKRARLDFGTKLGMNSPF